jgi:hypothetical protein
VQSSYFPTELWVIMHPPNIICACTRSGHDSEEYPNLCMSELTPAEPKNLNSIHGPWQDESLDQPQLIRSAHLDDGRGTAGVVRFS